MCNYLYSLEQKFGVTQRRTIAQRNKTTANNGIELRIKERKCSLELRPISFITLIFVFFFSLSLSLIAAVRLYIA